MLNCGPRPFASEGGGLPDLDLEGVSRRRRIPETRRQGDGRPARDLVEQDLTGLGARLAGRSPTLPHFHLVRLPRPGRRDLRLQPLGPGLVREDQRDPSADWVRT